MVSMIKILENMMELLQSSDPNKLTIETTAASNISLGDSSTGMYLINAETVTNATGSQITSTSGDYKECWYLCYKWSSR